MREESTWWWSLLNYFIQEVITMRNEITKLKKTVRKLQLEGGTSSAAAAKKPLASKN